MSIKTKLQTNNTSLQAILDTINTLPERGMADAYAVINVTYPEGSVCTCSSGNRTLELDNTLGYGFFLVNESGEWTVSCTDGSQTATKVVEITYEYQNINIELFYGTLFDSSVTSGWTQTGWSDHEASISGGLINLTGDPTLTSAALQNIGLYHYSEPVQCTSDMTLKVSVTAASCSYGSFNGEGKALLVAVSEPDNVDENIMDTVTSCAYIVASANIAGTGITSLSLPVGEYYLGIAFSNYVQLSADKVWIE